MTQVKYAISAEGGVQYPTDSTDKTKCAPSVKAPGKSGNYYSYENYSRETLVAHLKAHRSWQRWAKAKMAGLEQENEQLKLMIKTLEGYVDRLNG